jgi:OmpA-OmpF porin, OOP family
MKAVPNTVRLFALISFLLLVRVPLQAQIVDDIKNSVKQTATSKSEDQANTTTTNTFNKVDSGASKGINKVKGLFKKKKTDNTASGNSAATAAGQTPGQASPTNGSTGDAGNLSVYANYDFVPGEQIVFADDFSQDQDGEFPAHWKLDKGQGLVNKVGTDPAFFLTQGNYVQVAPRMKTEKDYLPENFTLEFDFYANPDAYRPMILFTTADDQSRNVQFGEEVNTGYFPSDFSAPYPGDKDNYNGKWHHAALIKKGSQIKCYEDQYRVLVIPDCGNCKLSYLEMGGIGDMDHPIVFRNFRLAEGGNMNMIGQKFTDAKIITHGINFDVDKSTLRPESMGTLNMIVSILKNNPEVRFEIDGHTDNSGDPNHNLQLSQTRADAVRAQLIAMGIDGSRLTTRGFGSTVPISDNSTLEGRANNRRVEFIRNN